MIHHIENLLRDLRITMKYLIKSTKGSEALNVRLESLKKDLEAIGKMFNESMKEYFEKKNGVIILNLVNLSIYENSKSPRDHSQSQPTMQSQLGGVNSEPCTEIFFFFLEKNHAQRYNSCTFFISCTRFLHFYHLYLCL